MTRMDTVDHIPHIELITNSGDEFHLTGHAAPLMAHVRAHAPEVLTVTELISDRDIARPTRACTSRS